MSTPVPAAQTKAAWAESVEPAVQSYWPHPTADAIPSSSKLDYATYTKAYTAVYNICTTNPPSVAGPLIMPLLDAAIAKWTQAARAYVGSDIQRYVGAWNAFEAARAHTMKLFAYPDRHFFPYGTADDTGMRRSLEDATRSPIEKPESSAATALRRWRLDVVLPVFGEKGSIKLNDVLPPDAEERKTLSDTLRQSFLACGLENGNALVAAVTPATESKDESKEGPKEDKEEPKESKE
ncbi:hypothetical protein AURDEDRAFT_110039 [Auricularia subglabra TFB-10046 SS5]|nr:hypothetical protein AURDEDRAFT_110039 [Auricularia subglabra TFB-10046 SS5]